MGDRGRECIDVQTGAAFKRRCEESQQFVKSLSDWIPTKLRTGGIWRGFRSGGGVIVAEAAFCGSFRSGR